MSLSKGIPTLQDMCLNNMAQNIIFHGERYKRRHENVDMCVYYKNLQYLFPDALLKKVIRNYIEGRQEFCNSVFHGLPCHEKSPCLELLFHQFSTAILPLTSEEYKEMIRRRTEDRSIKICEEVLTYIASRCKELRYLNQHFFTIDNEKFTKLISSFQNLRDLELKPKNPCDDILKEVFSCCLSIVRISLDGILRDESLFSLCKYSSENMEFTFCPEDGNCSRTGKCLRYLYVTTPMAKDDGIACGLQHLPQLRHLLKNSVFKTSSIWPYFFSVGDGIVTLQEATKANGKPPVSLSLTSIFVSRLTPVEKLQVISSCCPKLDTVHLLLSNISKHIFTIQSLTLKQLHLYEGEDASLNCAELKEFLSLHGTEIETLSFIDCHDASARYVHAIIQSCCNLKELIFCGPHHYLGKTLRLLRSQSGVCLNCSIKLETSGFSMSVALQKTSSPTQSNCLSDIQVNLLLRNHH